MEENKRTKTFLMTGALLILIILLLYPVVKNKIDEYGKKEISMEQEQSLGDGEEIEEEKNADLTEEMDIGGSMESPKEEEMLKVYFTLEGGSQEIKISIWKSEAGICCFFLPGFAQGKNLILEETDGNSIFIGDTEIVQGDVLKDIIPEKAYELTIYDKDNKVILKEPVIFMYSSELPVLSITTYSGEMTAIDEDKANEEAGMVVLWDEAGEELYAGEAESIRGRGNSTWGLSKKPYQFQLCEKADLFGFGKSKSWNLIANGYDETRLRNRIAMELAEALEMNYVPQAEMIDLYVNNIYYGNYYLTEKIKVEDERVAIRDMESIINDAYSSEELKKLERLQNEAGTRKWTMVDYENTDISGGYLFERELPNRFEEEVSGFITEQGDCYALKSPAYASKNQVMYIAGMMQEFQDAVEAGDGVNPTTGRHYSEYINVTSFVQKYLVEEISRNYDGGVTSSFFYKPDDSVSKKIYAGPIWDYDVAFGNCNLDKIVSNPIGITKLKDHVYGTDVFAGLYEKEDFYSQMTKMYEEKALPYLEYLLEEGIDQMVEETRQSCKMDSLRWEGLENRYQYYEEYDNDIRYLKYFIEERTNFLNEVWLEGEEYHSVTFVVDEEPWQITYMKDGEILGREPIPFRNDSLFIGWVTEAGVPYDQFKPAFEDMTFYAIWQEFPMEDTVSE